MKLAKGEFEIISKFIKEISGISLEKNKVYLIESRLSDMVIKENCKTFTDFFFKAKFNRALQNKIIDAISTNETSFFRDNSPFDALRYKVIPDLVDKKINNNQSFSGKTIKIWSAACSTGQEPYSIAMTFMDMLPDIKKWNINILGTDISDDAIRKASIGAFSNFELNRGLPGNLKNKYFTGNNGRWRVKDEVRSFVRFKKINLLQSFGSLGKFDIIFCRNVAIYFDIETKKSLFERLYQSLNRDGYLFIGSTETLLGISQRFQSKSYVRAIYYQPK